MFKGEFGIIQSKHTAALPDVQRVREQSPTYMQDLIGKGKLTNIVNLTNTVISTIGESESAGYVLKEQDRYTIVKFNFQVDKSVAEAKALQDWEQKGLMAPHVYEYGTLDEGNGKNVGFIVMEGLKKGNALAPTVSDYIQTHPAEDIPSIAAKAAQQLVMLHSLPLKDDEKFDGRLFQSQPQETWGENLTYVFEHPPFQKYVEEILNTNEIDKNTLIKRLKGIIFDKDSNVHGDCNSLNLLIIDNDVSPVGLIDPNPFVGNKYWDLATLSDRADVFERKMQETSQKPSPHNESLFAQDVLKAYAQYSEKPIDQEQLLANQVAHIIRKIVIKTLSQQDSATVPEVKELQAKEVHMLNSILKERVSALLSLPERLKKIQIPDATTGLDASFYIQKGQLTESQIEQVITQSHSDRAVRKFTSDQERFGTLDAFKSWLEKKRKIYSVVDESSNVYGLLWLGKAEMPRRDYMLPINFEKYTTTIAVRMYNEARGKGLSREFMQTAVEDYIKNEHISGMWIETSSDNPSVMAMVSHTPSAREVTETDDRGKVIYIIDFDQARSDNRSRLARRDSRQ